MFADDTVAAQLDLAADGTLAIARADGETMEGIWTIADGQVVITTDDTQRFTFEDGKLISVENPEYVFVKGE